MPAIERAHRHKVECRDKQPRPAREREGMQLYIQSMKGERLARKEISQPIHRRGQSTHTNRFRQQFSKGQVFRQQINQRVTFQDPEHSRGSWLNWTEMKKSKPNRKKRQRNTQPRQWT